MASKNRSSGGDFVLESRHLVGLFLLLVVIFGVVFTLGYLMGRSQYDAKLRATVGSPVGFDTEAAPSPIDAKGKAKGQQAQPQAPPDDAAVPKKNSDWDFYHSAEPQTAPDHLQAPPKAVSPIASPAPAVRTAAPSSKTVKSAKVSAGTDTPPMAKGAIMLQVAAVLHQDDALALAQALQQKKFPAIVVPPGADKYYRVQVGPYRDDPSATKARQDLEAKGFKSIIKR